MSDNQKNYVDQSVITDMQQAAREGKSAVEILNQMQAQLDTKFHVLNTILYFHQAFKWPLSEITQLGAWRGFPDGNWSDEKINQVFEPFLRAWVEQDNQTAL